MRQITDMYKAKYGVHLKDQIMSETSGESRKRARVRACVWHDLVPWAPSEELFFIARATSGEYQQALLARVLGQARLDAEVLRRALTGIGTVSCFPVAHALC